MDLGIVALMAIILGSVAPTLLYLTWMWRADKHRGVNFKVVAQAFLSGATLSVIGGVILSGLGMLAILIVYILITGDTSLDFDLETGWLAFITAVLIAPFAEELCKAGSVMLFRRRMESLETGIVIGASVGLGFAAVENILYGVSASVDGLEFALLLIGLRSVTSALGHAGYTAISGYGIAKYNRSRQRKKIWVQYYLLAVLLHGFSNLLATVGIISNVGEWFQIACIGVLLAMDVSIIMLLRKRVKQLDQGAEQPAAFPPVQPL